MQHTGGICHCIVTYGMTEVLALHQIRVPRCYSTNHMACLTQHTCKPVGYATLKHSLSLSTGDLSCIDEDSTGVSEEVSRLADGHSAMHPQSS